MAYRRDISFAQQHLQLLSVNVTMRMLNVAVNVMETGVWNGDLIQEWKQSFFAYLNELETQMLLQSHLEHQGTVGYIYMLLFRCITCMMWFGLR